MRIEPLTPDPSALNVINGHRTSRDDQDTGLSQNAVGRLTSRPPGQGQCRVPSVTVGTSRGRDGVRRVTDEGGPGPGQIYIPVCVATLEGLLWDRADHDDPLR